MKKAMEWPTLALIIACTATWAVLVYLAGDLPYWVSLPALAVTTAFHSSLQHEVLHGHPSGSARLNELLVFPALGLVFPYRRFRALHLRHHNDDTLTDPYDDPESFYLAMADWQVLPKPLKALMTLNNTLTGRLLFGPPILTIGFLGAELRAIFAGDRKVIGAWLLHIPAVALVVGALAAAGFPLWLYCVGVAWPAMSLILLRTFAEHQASEHPGARTAIIESGRFFSLLFLNNNLHYIHHAHPRAPWYALPGLYRERRAAWLRANDGYGYAGYGDVAVRYLLRIKNPVPHPYLRRSADRR